MLVYLAGPITGSTMDEANGWREELALNLPRGFSALNPLRREATLQQIVEKGGNGPIARMIFAGDVFDVRRADVVLANLRRATRISLGTVFELGMAYALNKPTVVVMEENGNPHEHAFVRQSATFIVEDLDQAVKVLGRLA